MLSNKDIRVENGFLIINGDKYTLDGQSPETIMQIVEENSDSTPTAESIAPVQSGGVHAAINVVNEHIDDVTSSSNHTEGNVILSRFGKLRILTFNRATYADVKSYYNDMNITDKPPAIRFSVMIRTSNDNKYMTTPFVYIGPNVLVAMHFAAYNADGIEGQIGDTDRLIGEIVYTVA